MNKTKLKNLKYVGTFTRDLIPKLKLNECCISNSASSEDENGVHWLSLFCLKKGKVYIYDSFFRKTDIRDLRFPKKYIEVEIDNKDKQKIVQNIIEVDCGHRSLASILTVDKYGLDFFNLN